MIVICNRKVKVKKGTKSQTVNICTKEGIHGRYDYRIRLRPPFFVEPEYLVEKRFGSIQEIVTYLKEQHKGIIEKSPSASYPPKEQHVRRMKPKGAKLKDIKPFNQSQLSNNTKLQNSDANWGVSSEYLRPCESCVLGYSERGIMNALFYEIQNSATPNRLLGELLSLTEFPYRSKIDNNVMASEILIEQSFSNFGDADLVLLINTGKQKISIFAEAKVKPAQSSKWTIEDEFEKFVNGVESKLNSSNLFTQLYHKLRMINSLSKGGLPVLQNGLSFPGCSSRPIRKIGSNPVVLRAIEMISQHLDDVYYLAIVPDSPKNLDDFFENKFQPMGFSNLPEGDVDSFGYLAWSDIKKFCVSQKLDSTLRVFNYNEGQIF